MQKKKKKLLNMYSPIYFSQDASNSSSYIAETMIGGPFKIKH